MQKPHWLWSAALYTFFTLYTFLAIGLGGFIITAAWIWRRSKKVRKLNEYPTVTFIVPARDEEKHISRCLTSLFKAAAYYPAPCQIIVVDDGSTDQTYRNAWKTIQDNRKLWPHVRAKVVWHSANLGKLEALRTATNKAMSELIATVDADTWWGSDALYELVKRMKGEGKAAISGYIHPSDGKDEKRMYIILQQLEYSQGLGIFRSAQALANAIPVIPGPMGLYEAYILREILNEKRLRSVTEDLEITLEMQKRGFQIGYTYEARSSTIAPSSFKAFWTQRLRWFIGWLHNLLKIHRSLLSQRSWLCLVLWHAMLLGYGGGLLELTALFSLPIFLYFAPDKILFLLNLLIYLLFVLTVGTIYQAIAFKFSYGKYNHKRLLPYTPLYYVLRLINIFARVVCLIKYMRGDKGCWRKYPKT